MYTELSFEQMVRLLQIAARLKQIRVNEDYTVVNRIFAWFLQAADFQKTQDGEMEEGEIMLLWETQDEHGALGADQAYFDLFSITLNTPNEVPMLRIPAPILDPLTILWVAKIAHLVEAGNGFYEEPKPTKPGELEYLLGELYSLVPDEELKAAAKRYLA